MDKSVSAMLTDVYERLFRAFGPQHWWPADTAFEVAAGAILTQNTNWSNVEKAITNLRKKGLLSARAIHGLPVSKLAELIRPAGYYNVKAKRLKEFTGFLIEHYGGSLRKMRREDVKPLRDKLLAVHGIGDETADSILLYALEKPVFVIDAYTKRVISRHGLMDYGETYEEYQRLFHIHFQVNGTPGTRVRMFNEYHALFVAVGKNFCKSRKPACDECPLKEM
jgi:endonuclease-3 related protein